MQRKLLQQLPLLYRRADWKLELEPLCGKSSEEALHVVVVTAVFGSTFIYVALATVVVVAAPRQQ